MKLVLIGIQGAGRRQQWAGRAPGAHHARVGSAGMSQISKKLRDWAGAGSFGFSFYCPGCDHAHTIHTSPGGWGFNGNLEQPTFTPSVLVTHAAKPDASEEFKEWRTARVCHSFVTDGRIQFLSDCTHALAGQTLDLPDFPKAYR